MCTIRKFQTKQGGLKLSETQHLLISVGGLHISAEDRSLYSARDKSSLYLKVRV